MTYIYKVAAVTVPRSAMIFFWRNRDVNKELILNILLRITLICWRLIYWKTYLIQFLSITIFLYNLLTYL